MLARLLVAASFVPFLVSLLCGCAADAGRRAESTTMKSQASREIARICALPADERQREIDRVKQEAGMTIVCQSR